MTLHHRGVIVIRGSPNSETGALSSIAKERCALALTEYARQHGWKFLLSGGNGAHFKITVQPHAVYLKRHLVSRGVSAQEILELVERANAAKTHRSQYQSYRSQCSHIFAFLSEVAVCEYRIALVLPARSVSNGNKRELHVHFHNIKNNKEVPPIESCS